MKLPSAVLFQWLADATKVDSASPAYKQSNDKNKVSNFRPISVLNSFYRIYESVIKNQLFSVLNNFFSPYIVAYRESYNTKHVLNRLLEEWRENLDKNYIAVGVFMDFSKTFDCILHDLLINYTDAN